VKRKFEETPEELRGYHNAKIIALGAFQVTWISSFGEKNVSNIGNINTKYNGAMERFLVRILNMPEVLYLEEPKLLSLKITNLLPITFRFKLYISDEKTKSIMINALSQIVSDWIMK